MQRSSLGGQWGTLFLIISQHSENLSKPSKSDARVLTTPALLLPCLYRLQTLLVPYLGSPRMHAHFKSVSLTKHILIPLNLK